MIHTRSLTARPWKMMIGRRSGFLLGWYIFGGYVKLPGSTTQLVFCWDGSLPKNMQKKSADKKWTEGHPILRACWMWVESVYGSTQHTFDLANVKMMSFAKSHVHWNMGIFWIFWVSTYIYILHYITDNVHTYTSGLSKILVPPKDRQVFIPLQSQPFGVANHLFGRRNLSII